MEGIESKIIEILVQGGLASVALASLWINYKTSSNHINHNTDALNRLEVTMAKLAEYLETKLK